MTFPNGDTIEGVFENNVFKGNPYQKKNSPHIITIDEDESSFEESPDIVK